MVFRHLGITGGTDHFVFLCEDKGIGLGFRAGWRDKKGITISSEKGVS